MKRFFSPRCLRNIKRGEESVENMEKEEKENAEMMQKIEVEFKRLEDDATRVSTKINSVFSLSIQMWGSPPRIDRLKQFLPISHLA